MSSKKITREDLESKFRELQGDVDDTKAEVASYAAVAAVAAIVTVAAIAFVLGRRKGRRKSTIVEIRRV